VCAGHNFGKDLTDFAADIAADYTFSNPLGPAGLSLLLSLSVFSKQTKEIEQQQKQQKTAADYTSSESCVPVLCFCLFLSLSIFFYFF
jgi:hypothetical protein